MPAERRFLEIFDSSVGEPHHGFVLGEFVFRLFLLGLVFLLLVVFFVRGENSQHELTLIRLSGNEHALLLLPLARIEAQLSLAGGSVLPVTLVAILRQDRPDITAEVERCRRGTKGREREKNENVAGIQRQAKEQHVMHRLPRNAALCFKHLPGP